MTTNQIQAQQAAALESPTVWALFRRHFGTAGEGEATAAIFVWVGGSDQWPKPGICRKHIQKMQKTEENILTSTVRAANVWTVTTRISSGTTEED